MTTEITFEMKLFVFSAVFKQIRPLIPMLTVNLIPGPKLLPRARRLLVVPWFNFID